MYGINTRFISLELDEFLDRLWLSVTVCGIFTPPEEETGYGGEFNVDYIAVDEASGANWYHKQSERPDWFDYLDQIVNKEVDLDEIERMCYEEIMENRFDD